MEKLHHTQFPQGEHLTITMLCLSKLKNQHFYTAVKIRLYLDITSFSPNVPSVLGSCPEYDGTLSSPVSLVSSSLWQFFFYLSWYFMTMTVLGSTSQAFCWMPLNLDLSNIFLAPRLGLWVWEKNNMAEVIRPSRRLVLHVLIVHPATVLDSCSFLHCSKHYYLEFPVILSRQLHKNIVLLLFQSSCL